MSRIHPVQSNKASEGLKKVFDLLQQKHGKVLHIFQHMGQSLPALEGFLALSGSATKTSLSPILREKIALLSAAENHCDYCNQSHTGAAKNLKLKDDEIEDAKQALANNPKEQAILQFVQKVIRKRGVISDEDIDVLKQIGISDQEIVEIHLVTMINMFTNYFNHIADTALEI